MSLDTAREKIAPTRDERKFPFWSYWKPRSPRVAAFFWRRIEGARSELAGKAARRLGASHLLLAPARRAMPPRRERLGRGRPWEQHGSQPTADTRARHRPLSPDSLPAGRDW